MANSEYVECLKALGFVPESAILFQGQTVTDYAEMVLGRRTLVARDYPLHFMRHPIDTTTLAVDDSGRLWFAERWVDLRKAGFTDFFSLWAGGA